MYLATNAHIGYSKMQNLNMGNSKKGKDIVITTKLKGAEFHYGPAVQ